MAETPKPQSIRDRFRGFLNRVRARVPRGLRLALGLVLILGGTLGFLPILGFWMIPLGVAVAALDIQLYRRWKRRQKPK
ncbi:hypothetical protein FGK63_07740 [Ruegeria sediminis]|uniref:Tellurium resistance protein TerC n=1 Tax=Ruegeria sediminis TaxID=2583820 RepID=A0ABY2X287_9RHOB|nr:hypothetical protein [Ruegeria sediminis]TMV09003.1 hypothetical protein FGK63_07740 [Ruegeria sediminis]